EENAQKRTKHGENIITNNDVNGGPRHHGVVGDGMDFDRGDVLDGDRQSSTSLTSCARFSYILRSIR
ncbi:MAG: hypothetical protein ACKPKO_42985, partial [Candidatus Fonsibacter sp.]